VSHCRAGAAWWERDELGLEGDTAATDQQTRVLAAGPGGSNSETLVSVRLACVGGGRERGRVKGTDGRAGE